MRLTFLPKIQTAKPLAELDEEELKELQQALQRLGYPVRTVDGLLGPRTRTAWAEFKTDVFQGNPDMIGPGAVAILQEMLDGLSPTKKRDFSTKEGTIDAIGDECRAQGLTLVNQIAYVLATVEHETAKTFKPVKEAYWLSEEWRKKNLRYYPYYGRGYVQLTWDYNYRKYGQILGRDLLNKPDIALEPEVALFVLVHGFKTGAFTGRKIADYINEHATDFRKARRCINGNDKAAEIADLAEKYVKILSP